MAKKTQKIADSDCLPKTQNSANTVTVILFYCSGCIPFDACPKVKTNGGSNSNCPKVAKFLDV